MQNSFVTTAYSRLRVYLDLDSFRSDIPPTGLWFVVFMLNLVTGCVVTQLVFSRQE